MLYNFMDWHRRTLNTVFNHVATGMVVQANMLHAMKLLTPFPKSYEQMAKHLSAGAEISRRIARHNGKPCFNLKSTDIAGKNIAVDEEIVSEKAFGNLLHFKRDTTRNDPKVLLVAPMSGHYATLLRDTVRSLLPNHDVYITDWKNPRDVPRSSGDFSLEDYVDYLRDFIKDIGPGVHIAGLSQSTVPVLAVTSLLAAENSPLQPVSMTLAGGPIDARVNPTAVGKFAQKKSIHWFRDNLISPVPSTYAGHGRNVYPGLLQLINMTSIAPDKHVRSYKDLFNYLSAGDVPESQKIKDIRDEYESVSDLPATYYLDTVREVFQQFTLARGVMTWKGIKVEPSKISRTALMTLEGEKDDICAPGQTLVAHILCSNIPGHLHFSNIEKGAGHYELLNGDRITGFIRAVASRKGIQYDVPTEGTAITPSLLHPAQVKAYLGTPSAANDVYKSPQRNRA